MREFTEAWGRSEKTPLWLMAGGAALLTVAGIASPPDSALMVAGGVVSGLILVARPDIAFALIFGIESLFTEDVLLVNEQLEQTIYKISLPYLGLNIFEAALLLLALITFLQQRGVVYGTRLDFALAWFGAACVVGYITCLFYYKDPALLFEPRRLMHLFVAYYLTVNLLRTKESLLIFLTILLAAVALKAGEGVYLFTAGQGLQIKWKIRAIFTDWADSLMFVTYLLILAAFLVERVRFPGKWIFTALSPVVFFSLLVSYKRAYYIAILAGFVALFWIQGRKSRFRLILFSGLAAVMLMGLITITDQWTAVSLRVQSIVQPTKESSANYRLVEWQNALICIRKNPLFGIGLGGVMPMEIWLSRTNLLGVHNTFLWVAVKMGAFGLFPYLLVHFAFLRRLHRQNEVLRDPFLRVLSKGIYCSFIAFCAAQMFAPMFAQMRTAAYLGVILGIGMMLAQHDYLPPSQVQSLDK
ncbi:MAG TPA: O-antigen ligase family protein [bacterium]|nr:O-antigen ligase family protein [bacterium]